ELISLLKEVNRRGWLESITVGDPGVGDTLEHALGIARNNLKTPDFKGIELKTTRVTKEGVERGKTRSTLFSKTPDGGMNYHEILEAYGKMQIPRGCSSPRFQLCETVSSKRVNAYDLFLKCDHSREKVLLLHSSSKNFPNPFAEFVSSWEYQTLKQSFSTKHRETMWIGAESRIINGKEYFHYTLAEYTGKPNTTALIDFIDCGIITVDLLAYITSEGRHRDHGMLWKIAPKNRSLLFGTMEKVDLETKIR
ncbi:MAG: MvaI/BcnI family restriction endonuclease, partial [Candidatus Enteromonas sp.]|nr:MvaI/BcnI family restriction endonuclease [Candidatus Enteromonas sp.]